MTMNTGGTDTFSDLLYMFRKRARLTQQQLAEAVGMHRHAISRWEQGQVLPASKAIVLELARFLRLTDQEARQLLDASLTAPTPLWGVPLPRNLLFTGREDILETLHTHLGVEQFTASPQVSALQGLGGVGKTQVALEYAYRYALEYHAIFWIEAGTTERVLFSLQRIAELIRLPEGMASDQRQIVKTVQRWLVTHTQWLLIWDNLENLDILQRVLPVSLQGAFLLTTRRQALGTLARGIEVPSMGPEESLVLLLRRAKVLGPTATGEQARLLAIRQPADYAAASELVTMLGGLPLALDQAGAYLEETGCSFTDYLHRYEQRRTSLLDRRGSLGDDHPQSVTTTFRLSQERVELEQPEAADLLRVCAFLHPEAIPEELFQVGDTHLGNTLASIGNDPVQFDQALAVLRNLSLVQRNAQTHTISLHRLVQRVLREQMEPSEERLWGERVIRLVNRAFPEAEDHFATWTQCERYLAQALACVPLISLFGRDLPEAGHLLQRAGNYLLERGRLSEAEPLLALAVTLGEQHAGHAHPILIPRLTNQAKLAWNQGRYKRAEELLSRVLAIEKQEPETTPVQLGETLNNLGLLFWEQGKYAQAEPLLQKALDLREQLLGPTHMEITHMLSNLALLYCSQGRYAQAELLYQRTLQIQEQALGPEDPWVALTLTNLATLYCDQGQYTQAEVLYQRAVQIQERALGPGHLSLSKTLTGLATLCRMQAHYEQAESLYQQALQIQERMLGLRSPRLALTLSNLATLYSEQGHYTHAESLYQRALQIQEQTLGPEHPDTASTLSGLAQLYAKQEQYAHAESLYQRALQIQEQVLGPEHPRVALSYYGLALLCTKQGQDAQAEPLLQRALQIQTQCLDLSHPERARSMAELVHLQEKHNQKKNERD